MTDTHHFHPSILRAYDIRGVVGETLFVQDALFIGKAFGTAVIRATGKSAPSIALAYDGRLSTPELRDALIAGLKSTGVTIWNFGIGPTPLMYFSVHHSGADAGIMVTGSHNPPTHNGFKMMLGKASFFGDDVLRLGALATAGDFEVGSGTEIAKESVEAYLDVLVGGYEAAGAKPIKAVIDPGNGSASEVSKRVAEKLGHVTINDTIDGHFPNHHPDPTVAKNLQQLIAEVQKQGADVGIAFDGDGDRIGAVDRQGRILYGDQLMVLFARDVLKTHPGATIIADVKASKALFDDIAAHGGRPIMCKTGHSLVKTRMKEESAKLAGEMSGHIFFADRYFGYDDGIYSAVRLINILAHSDETLEQMLDGMPLVYNTPEIRIDVPEERKFSIIEDIRLRLSGGGYDVNDVDGVRVSSKDGWWLARASNTQAAISVRAESTDEAALETLKSTIREQLEACGVEAVI